MVKPASSAQMIGMLENGRRELTHGWMDRLAAALDCKPGDFLPESDQAAAAFDTSIATELRGVAEPPSPFAIPIVQIPIEGKVQAGLFAEVNELLPEERGFTYVPADSPYIRLPLKGFRLFGDSMNLIYPHGTVLIVAPTIHLGEGWMPKPGQHVIVQRLNDWGESELTVKEIHYGPGAEPKYLELYPRSSNPSFQKPWRFPILRHEDAGDEERMRIIGLVMHFVGSAPGV